MKFKNFLKLILLLSLAAIVAACSSNSSQTNKSKDETSSTDGSPQQGGEIVIAYYTDVTNYDPLLGGGGSDHPLLWPVYDTLIKFTPELEPEPGLAEKWEFLDDTTLVLYLREGVTFHDGTPFDAEAVKFNIERANSEESNVSDLQVVEKVEIVDTHVVELHLKNPDSSILLKLSDRGGMMVSPTAFEEGDLSQNPVGAGPYKVANRIPNSEITFEAYKDYWQEGQPYLDKMIIKIMEDENARINALKSGEVDFAENITAGNVATLESDPDLVVEDVMAVTFRMIYLNTSIPPMDNKAVRLAIQHAIDREAIIEGVNFGMGEPANTPFPKSYWASDPDMVIEYDPEKAKQILADAGFENVKFKMNQHANAHETKIAEAIKAQLAEIGIEVDLQVMEINASTASFFTEKKVEASLSRWTGRPDPQMTIDYLFSSDSFYNTGGHSTTEIESLIAEAAATYDQEKRAELYKEISKKAILEEAIAIPILFEPRISAMNKKVGGFEPNMQGKPVFSTIWMEQ